MPIIKCPKCQGQMRFPDGVSTRRVKCPTCGNVFMSTEGEDPSLPKSDEHAPPAKPVEARSDFARDDDRDRRSRRQRDDEDDRTSRRRRDDDDRDRGRDDDDRDRRRKRRRDEDDDYDRRRRGPDPATIDGQFNRTSLALLLCYIGGWLHVGSMALVVFVVFLDWLGIREGLQLFLVMSGLLAMGNWLTSATGLGFMVTGPRKYGALGLSIATAAVAGFHLLLLIVIGTSREFGPFGFGTVIAVRPAEVYWDSFVSQIRAIPFLVFVAIGAGDFYRGVFQGSLPPVFANLVEIARMVLFFLALRAIMLCARDGEGAKLCKQATIGFAICCGALLFVGILFGLLFLVVRPSNPTAGAESTSAVVHLFFLVLYSVLTGMAVGSTLIIRSVKGRVDYRR